MEFELLESKNLRPPTVYQYRNFSTHRGCAVSFFGRRFQSTSTSVPGILNFYGRTKFSTLNYYNSTKDKSVEIDPEILEFEVRSFGTGTGTGILNYFENLELYISIGKYMYAWYSKIRNPEVCWIRVYTRVNISIQRTPYPQSCRA